MAKIGTDGPDSAVNSELRPTEHVTLRQPALLSGRMALTHKDLLFVTNERVLLAVREKEGYRISNRWNLEDLPPVTFEIHSGQPTVLILAGTKMSIKDFNAKSVAEQIEHAKRQRIHSLQAVAPPAAPGAGPIIHERETIREIVKVPCRYCQQLNLMNSAKCLSCGAPLG